MCGIVGMVGSDIDLKAKKAFKDLLIIDTIRGGDSTGFLAVDGTEVVSAKKAIDGFGFTNMAMYSKRIDSMAYPRALIGHNRAATKGKVTDGNAHPFKHNDTYLVHNGSLRTWQYGAKALHNCNHTDVDSEAVCFNVDEHGIKDTIESLDGAFALVIYDDITKTISFTRNDERPLYFARVKDKDLTIYASEAYMINLVADKHKIELMEEPWLLNTEIILSYDVGIDKEIVASEDIEEDVTFYVPEAPLYGSWNRLTKKYDYYGGDNTPVKKSQVLTTTEDTGGTKDNGTGVKDNNVVLLPKRKELDDVSLALGEKLYFLPYNFKSFTAGYGMIEGDLYWYGGIADKYGKGIMYKHNHESYKNMRGKLIQVEAKSVTYPNGRDMPCYPSVNYIAELSGEEESEYWKEYSEWEYTPAPPKEDKRWWNAYTFRGKHGDLITADDFGKITINGCAMCGDPIPVTVSTSQEIAWVFEGEPLCTSCTALQGQAAERNGITLEDQITGGAL